MSRASLMLLATLALGFASRLTAAVPPHFDDAPLRAVQFIDAKEGWAVGDQGVVWHSIDGGATWERQPTGTLASLRAVRFLTPYFGWAVGRVEMPNDAGSQGVILATADGGATWKELTSNTLPGLNAVRLFDDRNAVVAGDGTDAFPTGAFRTADGGQTWTPLAGPRTASWTTAEFASPTSGLVAGAWGNLMLVRDGKLTAAEFDPLAGRAVRGMASDGQRVLAVCDGGRVLTSSNGGVKWGFANLPLPEATLTACDLRCVASAGNHVWVAGRPGSMVFHSSDFGKTWDVQKTGQPVPLNGLFMRDEQNGIAVGDLGTILATADGGKSWTMRKCGGQRAGVLVVQARAGTVPLGVVAQVGGKDGYLTASLALASSDPATADLKRGSDEFRLSAAMRMVGGAVGETAWGFPLSVHAAESPARSASEGEASTLAGASGWSGDTLRRQLVLAIRTWKPEVLVVDAFPATDPLEQAVLIAAQEAFKLAADPMQFPEQIDSLGLAVHAPKKLYARSADAPEAAVKCDLSTFTAELADTPRDCVEPAVGLLLGASNVDRQAFRLLSHRLKGAESHANLTDGVDLAAGGAGRRRRREINPDAAKWLAEREQASRTRRQLENLASAAGQSGDSEKALAQIAGTALTLPDEMAARVAVGVGRQLASEGKWTAAREMFALAVEKYPAHPEAAEAVRWLARYYASSEVRRRIELGHQAIYQKTAFVPAGGVGLKQANHVEPSIAREVFRFSNPDAAKRWNQACLDLEPNLAAFGAGFVRDPATNLSLIAARRQLGLYGDVVKTTNALVRASGGLTAYTLGTDAWRDCLAAELWLGNPASVPAAPKPLGMATFAPLKPLLDGKLDDACWKNARPLPLTNAAGTTMKTHPTKAMIAFDDAFLYLAVTCGHPEGKQVPKAEKRGYDADLRGHDRVELLLDQDRDYQTYYRFRVDHRGCVAEDCWGDKTWNPRWFVAVEPTVTGWTAEIAIPLSELTGSPVGHGSVWAANVVRVLPGDGVQSWSGPAAADVRPEGLGLLQFEGK